MFVLIKSNENRVSASWQEGLEKAGFKVSLEAKGLSDYEAIRRLLVEHIQFAFAYKRISVNERKEMFGRF